MGLALLYLLHILLEVPLHRQQTTWDCLLRTFKKKRRGVRIVLFASTISYQYYKDFGSETVNRFLNN